MARFNSDNSAFETRADLEIANCAYDEAWGALKGMKQREGIEWDEDMVFQIKQSLADAVTNAWGSEDLALSALEHMGRKPTRSIYSLECA